MIAYTLALMEMARDTTTTLVNFATATTTDRNTFNKLTKMISNQSSRITNPTNKFLLEKEVAEKFKTKIASIKKYNRNGGRGGGSDEVDFNAMIIGNSFGIHMVIIGHIVLCKI